MKLYALLLLAVLAAGPVAAKPVHVALKPSAAVAPDADGFFTLASVADVTGGDSAMRTRLSAIVVGRAPLTGETRRLTRGDLALKLRQAGCDPDKAAILEGAETAEVTSGEIAAEKSIPADKSATLPSARVQLRQGRDRPGTNVNGPGLGFTASNTLLIHRGDAVTIIIQSGPLTIHADGVARENGVAGQTIRIHRDGVMTDLAVQVLDARTVQLEI